MIEARALPPLKQQAQSPICLGVVQVNTERVPQGVRECERALELNRNLANAHGQIGNAKILLGRAEETEAHIQEALHLSPRDTLVYLWCMFAGIAKLYLGKDDEAVAWLRQSLETNTNNPSAHFLLAAALARLGRPPEAHSEVQAGFAINPSFSIAVWRTIRLWSPVEITSSTACARPAAYSAATSGDGFAAPA